ncbi:MAG: oligosaccharide flippase family protein [Bacteroidota bacterium]|jgi:O-antigen/teichoic acid export membrane protein|nr:oligosaccharide flippase family protein [Ignavibacteria bacterium]MCU7500355.1 oligosaccharide flippase family protein [Ignavibacteria bacterium]MCU7511883.1 oligosaccharide flippase family protein [Ignavibacteria bacterium]MCU7519916.1 oligosaccharide flippase family protein [Ignavibacteria bacterium]MCU7522991.1 oligosaccharide flippase family protein [Ignavibacteria bacterium]
MSLFKSTAWYTLGNLFARSLGFILLPFYSNLIPAEDFGRYALLMSAYAVMSAVYQGGLFPGFSKYFLEADDESKRKKIFTSCFSLIFLISLVITVLATLLNRNVSFLLLGSWEYGKLVLLTAWMLFIDTIFLTVLHLLKTKEESRQVIYYTSLSALFNLILNFFFVFYLRRGVEGIFLAQLFSGGVIVVIMAGVLKENFSLKKDNAVIRNILIFSFPLLIAGILSTFVDVADRFILDHFLDKKLVGIYSFSYRIAMVMNIFVISFRTAWTPYSLRLLRQEKNYSILFGHSLTRLLAISLLIFLGVSLFIKDLFSFHLGGTTLFNPEYTPGIIIIPLVLMGYLFSGLVSFYSVYPYQSGKSYHFLISDLAAFIVNVALNFILIPKYGIMGAALATMISFFAGFIYLFVISRPLKVTYQIKELLTLILYAVAFYLLGRLADNFWMNLVLVVGFTIVIQRSLNLMKLKAG